MYRAGRIREAKILKKTVFLVGLLTLACGCSGDGDASPGKCLVVVSPHQDDETIMAGGTLYRAAHDGHTRIEIIYVTAGDALFFPGPCREESEEARRQKIIALREEETRAACRVLGLGPSNLHFLRYPDQGLVAESTFSNGRRVALPSEKRPF